MTTIESLFTGYGGLDWNCSQGCRPWDRPPTQESLLTEEKTA